MLGPDDTLDEISERLRALRDAEAAEKLAQAVIAAQEPDPVPPIPTPDGPTPEEGEPSNAHLWPVWHRPNQRTRSEVLRDVADAFSVTPDELRGPGRVKRLCSARAVYSAILMRRGVSLSQIGRLLGGRDHSTIIHSRKTFDAYYQKSALVRQVYAEQCRLEAEQWPAMAEEASDDEQDD